MTEKPRLVLETDPQKIAAVISAGKYRDCLPFWTRDGDALWIEKQKARNEGNRL